MFSAYLRASSKSSSVKVNSLFVDDPLFAFSFEIDCDDTDSGSGEVLGEEGEHLDKDETGSKVLGLDL